MLTHACSCPALGRDRRLEEAHQRLRAGRQEKGQKTNRTRRQEGPRYCALHGDTPCPCALTRQRSGELTYYSPMAAPQPNTSPQRRCNFEAGAKAMANMHANLAAFAETINRNLATLERVERVVLTYYERISPSSSLAYHITLNNLNEDLEREVRNKRSRQNYDDRRRLNMAPQRGMLRSAELDRFTADAAATPPIPPPESRY
jgi:hypothetical protein